MTTTEIAVAPIPHDFPFPICVVCQFPIPPHDLGGLEFQPRHASTCTPIEHTPDRTGSERAAAAVEAGAA